MRVCEYFSGMEEYRNQIYMGEFYEELDPACFYRGQNAMDSSEMRDMVAMCDGVAPVDVTVFDDPNQPSRVLALCVIDEVYGVYLENLQTGSEESDINRG